MFKITKSSASLISKYNNCVAQNQFLLKTISAKFMHYDNGGEYNFLNKFNYVGNHGIYWKHPESQFVIRITDDFEKCVSGNKSSDDTCWLYFSKKMLPNLMNEFNEPELIDLMNDIRNWKLIQTVPEKIIEWITVIPRTYSTFSKVSQEQKLFAAKHFVSTFFVDDPMEKLNSHEDTTTAAIEYTNNLRKIFSGQFDKISDMRQFKGQDNISDGTVEGAIRAIDMQLELTQSAQKLLKPEVYRMYQLCGHSYLNGVEGERALFQKHFPTKTTIGEDEGKASRVNSIGFIWVLSDILTDEKFTFHLNTANPVLYLLAWISSLENDLAGSCKDRTIDYSPMTFYNTDELGTTEVKKAQNIANKINEAKKTFENICETLPRENAEYYEHLEKFITMLTDFHYVQGLRNGNSRYGWIPTLD